MSSGAHGEELRYWDRGRGQASRSAEGKERRDFDLGSRTWGREVRRGRLLARRLSGRAPLCSSHVEGPHLLRGAPRGGSEHAECLPEVAPRRGGETEFVAYPHLRIRSKVTPLQSLQVSVRLSPNALVQVLNPLKRWVPGVYSFSFNPSKHIFIFSARPEFSFLRSYKCPSVFSFSESSHLLPSDTVNSCRLYKTWVCEIT